MKLKIKKRRSNGHKKKEIILAVCCISIVLCLASLFLFMPRITLKGKANLSVNIGTKYIEPGYKALYLGKDISKEVKIKQKINTDKEGTYEIIYTLKKGPFKTVVKRKVKVADIMGPTITLKGQQETLVCPKGNYQEEGYEAIDNVDGNVTEKVKVKTQKQEIIYEVEDKAGNKTTVKRILVEGDQQQPTLTLQGGDVMFIYLHEPYQEPGYQALDNCDGDITDKVQVSGVVNSDVYGENELTYQVRDAHQNVTEVKRKVKVVNKGGAGTIYLTFDDGPRMGTTNVILDILKETGVKATFFVTANGPDELIKREVAEGHTVGLHTATHNYATLYASSEAYFNDLQTVHDRVQRLTGVDSRIIRFPGGSSNTISRKYSPGIMSYLTEEVIKRGYQYYDWNLSSGDAGEFTSSDAIYQNVISKLSSDRVNMILMHDIKPYTRDALKRIIEYGKENGYKFEAVTMETEMVRQKVNN